MPWAGTRRSRRTLLRDTAHSCQSLASAREPAAAALTVEEELEAVCVDVMQRDAELRRHVFNDAAEAAGDEEHLHAALMKLLHQLPEQTNTHHLDTDYSAPDENT